VVDSFVARCAGDDRINAKFARTDVPRLKKMLVDQVCEAAGGPRTYTGRAMRERCGSKASCKPNSAAGSGS
jgi:hemoglobin